MQLRFKMKNVIFRFAESKKNKKKILNVLKNSALKEKEYLVKRKVCKSKAFHKQEHKNKLWWAKGFLILLIKILSLKKDLDDLESFFKIINKISK